MKFIVFSSRVNQYGLKEEMMSVRNSEKPHFLINELRNEGWAHNRIKVVEENGG